MIVAIDVDGPLADLGTELLHRYNRDYDDALTPADLTSWALHDVVKPECGRKIYEYLREPNLYEYVEPLAGAMDGVQALRDAGHEPFFVSSCTYGMVDQKAEWLTRHGFAVDTGTPFLPPDFVVVHDRMRVEADLLIDDGWHNVRPWVERKRRQAILFNTPANKGAVDDVPSAFWMWCSRVDNWPQVVAHVQRLGVQK